MTFDEFEKAIVDQYGDAVVYLYRADEIADMLDDAGLVLEEWDADDPVFWEIAAELAELEMYALDPHFPNDDYLDAGEEWELTAESEEGYGED